jgi:TPR repeat protein/serine/threonine protein kinase
MASDDKPGGDATTGQPPANPRQPIVVERNIRLVPPSHRTKPIVVEVRRKRPQPAPEQATSELGSAPAAADLAPNRPNETKVAPRAQQAARDTVVVTVRLPPRPTPGEATQRVPVEPITTAAKASELSGDRTQRAEPSADSAGAAGGRGGGGGEAGVAPEPQRRPAFLMNLPSALAGQYKIDDHFTTKGGEATILLLRSIAKGEEAIAKLYHKGIEPKSQILEQLRVADPRYVIKLLEHGKSDGIWYELQEYAPHGSLADLLGKRGGKLAPDEVKTILARLHKALSYIHALDPEIVHCDLKPSNILIRQLQPLEVVLADFGIARNLDFSERHTEAHGTIGYMPPEALGGEANKGKVSREFDWWSLGMVIAELLGSRPFAGLSNLTIAARLGERAPIDLQALWEPKTATQTLSWTRLCRGLLQPERKERWGANEVARWLEGAIIALPQASEEWLRTGEWPATSPRRSTAHETEELVADSPYVLGGNKYFTLREFGEALVRNWDEAIKRVGRRRDIENWLGDKLGDHDALNRFLDIVEIANMPPQQQLAYFAAYVLQVPEVAKASDDGTRKLCLEAHLAVPEAQLAMAKLLLGRSLGAPDYGRAAALASAAAKAGVSDARELAASLEDFRTILAGAEAGDPTRQFELSDLLAIGGGIPADAEESARWLRLAAEGGLAAAQCALGHKYYYGNDGFEQSYEKAVACYRKAAEQGHADGEFWLGFMYKHGRGVRRNEAEGVAWYRRAAEQGHAVAAYNLGCSYDSGEGVPQDHAQAVAWYRRAADQGDISAIYNLGCSYRDGEGVSQNYGEAIACFRKAGEGGHASALYNLGCLYRDGRGVPTDYEQAIAWFHKAVEKGHAAAAYHIARMHDSGQGAVKDSAAAFRWYRKAAELGDVDAYFTLGVRYENGEGVGLDLAQAFAAYAKAAEAGHVAAMYSLGCCYDFGQGVPADHARAVTWYRKAAENGHASAMYNLACSYDKGQGVPKDAAQAAAWYRRAADLGHLSATFNLACSCRDGEGVPQNYGEALALYRKAADAGHVGAKFNIGRFHRDALGIARNYGEARVWFERAAKEGSVRAQVALGDMFLKGLGVAENPTTAVYWYRMAADQGDAEGQNYLGNLYELGNGVPRSLRDAIFWYRKAAAQGHTGAAYSLQRLEPQ